MNQNRTVAGRTVQAMMVGTIIAASSSGALAANLLVLSVNSGQTMIFDDTLGPQGEWSIPNAGTLDGTTVTTDFFSTYTINPSGFGVQGSVSWTGNDLNQDLNPGGPRAEASFYGGGQFTLRGQVYVNGVLSPLTANPNTVLLSGSVGPFGVIEDSLQPNEIDVVGSGALFIPTAGVLHDGSILSSNNFYITFTITQADQGGNLQDFGSTISTTTSFQFVLGATNDVPEPASFLLLLGGGAFVGLRRRRMNRK